MEEVRLFENEYDKPDLTDDILEHYGVKGMHWGVRRMQKSEERAVRARSSSDKAKSMNSRAQDYAQYRRNIANITGGKVDKKIAKMATKSAEMTRKMSNVMEARAYRKEAMSRYSQENFERSIDRGRMLVEQGVRSKSAGGILGGHIGRGVLTSSVRGMAKSKNATRALLGAKKKPLSSLIGGTTGKVAAKAWNISEDIKNIRDRNDIKNYEAYLKERRRQMEHSDILDDTIEHFGVKGMHWGIRKDGKPQGFQYGKAGKHAANISARTAATALAGYATKKAAEGYKNSFDPDAKRHYGKLAAVGAAATTIGTAATAKAAYDAYKDYSKERLYKTDVKEYKNNREAIEAKDIKYITANKDKFSVGEMNEVMNRLQTEQRLNDFYRQQNPSAKDTVKKILNNPVVKTGAVIAAGTGGYLLFTNAMEYSDAKKSAMKMGTTPPSIFEVFEKTATGYGPALKGNIKKAANDAFGNMQAGKSWNAGGKNKNKNKNR